MGAKMHLVKNCNCGIFFIRQKNKAAKPLSLPIESSRMHPKEVGQHAVLLLRSKSAENCEAVSWHKTK